MKLGDPGQIISLYSMKGGMVQWAKVLDRTKQQREGKFSALLRSWGTHLLLPFHVRISLALESMTYIGVPQVMRPVDLN